MIINKNNNWPFISLGFLNSLRSGKMINRWDKYALGMDSIGAHFIRIIKLL